jgi:hypothetical protein
MKRNQRKTKKRGNRKTQSQIEKKDRKIENTKQTGIKRQQELKKKTEDFPHQSSSLSALLLHSKHIHCLLKLFATIGFTKKNPRKEELAMTLKAYADWKIPLARIRLRVVKRRKETGVFLV